MTGASARITAAVFAVLALAATLALRHMDHPVALILVLPGYLVQAWLFEAHLALGGAGYVATVATVAAAVWTVLVLGCWAAGTRLARALWRTRGV